MKKEKNSLSIKAAKEFCRLLEQGKKPDQDLLREVAATALNLLPEAAVLGTDLFSAVWRQAVMATVEPVCFRDKAGNVEVFLATRANDESYPGCLHICGTPIRSSDKKNFKFISDRLATAEYKILKGGLHLLFDQPVEVKVVPEERGAVLSLAFLAELKSSPPKTAGDWYSWDEVKNNKDNEIVPYHRDWLIPTALKYWKKRI